MEPAAVNPDELAEVGSGDEEPEQFCQCDVLDPCSTTSCYCLAIKKKSVMLQNVPVQNQSAQIRLIL